jgi:predicted nuclease of predicted toxin-antitoxin system
MRTTYAIIIMIISFSFLSFGFDSNVYVPDVGDNWKHQLDSAMELIHRVDTAKYDSLVKYCDSVDFIIGSYSTTNPPHTIVINTGDMKLKSINNIAAVLVHESRHLYYYNNHIIMSSDSEELYCYQYENDFLNHLDYVEDWLYKNNIQQIIFYSNKLDKK